MTIAGPSASVVALRCGRAILVAIAVLLTPTAARAQAEHDEQIWTSVNVIAPASPDVDLMLEAHARYFDGASRLGQLLIRPSATYKLPRAFSVSAGYVYARTRPLGGRATDEHRSWEQVGYVFASDASGPLVLGRTRLEQRFRPDADGVGWRARQFVRAQLPLKTGSPIRAVVWNETFVGLNDTGWGARGGVDQVRTFVGLSLPVAKGATVEPGYFNQTVFRVGRDRVNHAFAAHLFVRLP